MAKLVAAAPAAATTTVAPTKAAVPKKVTTEAPRFGRVRSNLKMYAINIDMLLLTIARLFLFCCC